MIRLERAPRWPGRPLWAVAVIAVWGSMVAAIHAWDRAQGSATPTCLFRAMTGAPCATCGGTRAVFALARGDPGAALGHNPLVAVAVVLGAAWAALRLGAARRLVIACEQRARWASWVAAVIAVAANWVYVWNTTPG